MHFSLTSPCKLCPFRKDVATFHKGWLGKQRAQSIILNITTEQKSFACHETTEFTVNEDGEEDLTSTDNSKHCAGAAILLEKIKNPNLMMQLGERIGKLMGDGSYHYDRTKLKNKNLVVNSIKQFISNHT